MFKADTHELLCLFAAMIVADKHIYASEIEEFSKSVIAFYEKIDVESAPSEARLLMWFDINRENIQSKITQDNFEIWFEKLMHRVTCVYSAKAVIEVMQNIAHADDELHISEKALLVLVERHWPKVA